MAAHFWHLWVKIKSYIYIQSNFKCIYYEYQKQNGHIMAMTTYSSKVYFRAKRITFFYLYSYKLDQISIRNKSRQQKLQIHKQKTNHLNWRVKFLEFVWNGFRLKNSSLHTLMYHTFIVVLSSEWCVNHTYKENAKFDTYVVYLHTSSVIRSMPSCDSFYRGQNFQM